MPPPSGCQVVPMGRISMNNAFSGHPKRRVPHGGANIKSMEARRRKPTLKDFLGVTPLELLQKVTSDDASTSMALLRKLIGYPNAALPTSQDQSDSVEEHFAYGAASDSQTWHQGHFVGQPTVIAPRAQPEPLLEMEDTRTNLEKYIDMKRRGFMTTTHAWAMGDAPAYPALSSHTRPYSPTPAVVSTVTSTNPMPIHCMTTYNPAGTVSQCEISPNGLWGDMLDANNGPVLYDSSPTPRHDAQSHMMSTQAHLEDSHSYLPPGMQFDTSPAWLQRNSYLPQARQYSHMTAPIPGVPFHPGFSYATDFKYFYNYYDAEDYVGEIDGEDWTFMDSVGARVNPHGEEIESHQVRQGDISSHSLKPIITSKKRLESGKGVSI